MSDSVWNTLSAIDCKAHIEKKGQFSYLAWTWAWAMVKEKYPEATYFLNEDMVFADGSMEVRVLVEIEGTCHEMWLPVLDFKNQAIQNPNAFDINTARMRCLVKCLAMFGLGHYIYAGESAPQAPGLDDEEYAAIVKALADKDGIALLKLQDELGGDKMGEAFNRPERGQKTEFKETMRVIERAGHDAIDAYVDGLNKAVAAQDAGGAMELGEELAKDAWVKKRVWARLTDIQKHHITNIMKEIA